MINLMNEPEIFERHKVQGQLLDANSYVENTHTAVGFSSRCWSEDNGGRVFDTDQASRIANELCAYMRLLKDGKAV